MRCYAAPGSAAFEDTALRYPAALVAPPGTPGALGTLGTQAMSFRLELPPTEVALRES